MNDRDSDGCKELYSSIIQIALEDLGKPDTELCDCGRAVKICAEEFLRSDFVEDACDILGVSHSAMLKQWGLG